MSDGTTAEPLGDARLSWQRSLIRRRALSEQDVSRIHALQQMLGLDFGDAAVHLGLASTEDLQAAAQVQGRDDTGSGTTVLRPEGCLSVAHEPYGQRSEAVCALRTELLLRRAQGGEANALVVLSSRRGEGRSQLAAELAIAFSQLSLPTLLVDADLRHPRQHLLFGTHVDVGLSEAIWHKRPVRPYSIAGLPHLSLMTAGAALRSAQELLSHERLGTLMNDWRRQYQYIVVDTPAAASCPDAFAVARVAGRVLMVSRAAHTPHRDVREMLRRLTVAQAQVLGAVVNRF